MSDEGFQRILRKQVMEGGGRPLHPAFEHALDEGWIDPTAHEMVREGGDPFTVRERSLMGAISYYSIEGIMGPLTPLGMAMLANAMLGGLGLTDEEIEHGYEGIEVDPWQQVRHLSAEVRDQFRRADWHISEACRMMGLDDRGQLIPHPDKLPCGCPWGTHDASITQIGQHHEGNPWPIRDLFMEAKERGEWSP